MGKCRQCGMCCRAISLSYSKKEIAATWSDTNGKFIIKNWARISKEQALKNNPYVRLIQEENARSGQTIYWYSCKYLIDNRCSVHKDRPPVCKGYPWYEGEPDNKEFLYGEDCGYRVDQLTGVK